MRTSAGQEQRFDPAVLRAEPDNPLLDSRAQFPMANGRKKKIFQVLFSQACVLAFLGYAAQAPALNASERVAILGVLLVAWWLASFANYLEGPTLHGFLSLRHPRARSFYEAGVTIREVVQANASLLQSRRVLDGLLLGVICAMPTAAVAGGILSYFAGLIPPQAVEGLALAAIVFLFVLPLVGLWMASSLPLYRALWLIEEPDAVFESLEVRMETSDRRRKASEIRLSSFPGLHWTYPLLDAMFYLIITGISVVAAVLPLGVLVLLAAEAGWIGLAAGIGPVAAVYYGLLRLYSHRRRRLQERLDTAWRRICLEDDRRWQEIVSTLEERGIAKRA